MHKVILFMFRQLDLQKIRTSMTLIEIAVCVFVKQTC